MTKREPGQDPLNRRLTVSGVRLAADADAISGQAGELGDTLCGLGEHLDAAVVAELAISAEVAKATQAARDLGFTVSIAESMTGQVRSRMTALQQAGSAVADSTERVAGVVGSIAWLALNADLHASEAAGRGGKRDPLAMEQALDRITGELKRMAENANEALMAIRAQVHRLAEIQTSLDGDAGRLGRAARDGRDRSDRLVESLARQEQATAQAARALAGVRDRLGDAGERASAFSDLGRRCTQEVGDMLLASASERQPSWDPADLVASVAGHLCAARGNLVALTTGTLPPETAIRAISTHSDAIELALHALIDAGAEDAAAFATIWNEFRQTRDLEIIPLLISGRRTEAKALARGVQAERVSRMMARLMALTARVASDGQAMEAGAS